MTTTTGETTEQSPSEDSMRVLRVDRPELENFANQVKRFKAGEWDAVGFTRFRLRQGVYGQRQSDTQMIRVKAPFGGLTADQLEALSEITAQYAPLKKGHLTTRENIQFHHVPLDQTASMLRMLGDVGLSTREACGNTVRNVVAHPSAGVSKTEVFDVTPYAAAYARYFLRHPTTQNMPRKSKTAFSGSDMDEAITAIHDVGFIARIRDGRRGFKMVIGGGLSIMPQIAYTLAEFVSVEDYLKWSEALLRIYDRQDEERKNLMKARIKFTVKRLGIERIREMVKEELEGEWAKKTINLDSLLFIEDESIDAPPVTQKPTPEPASEGDYTLWKRTNVVEQRQSPFNMVYVRIERGDIFVNQWKALADIARGFAGGRVRIDQQQNMVFRWIRTESLYDLYKALESIGMNAAGRETIRDIVTCPGTDSCKLGITSSMGLNKAIGEMLDNMDTSDPDVSEIHIKASGCPNACGQHHIANIGFHGAVLKGKGGQVPAYEVFIGGNYEKTKGDVRIGRRLKARVPAKMVPEALTSLLDHYKKNRRHQEKFNEFVDRVGEKTFEDLLACFKNKVGPLDREHISNYMDWGKTTPYALQRGEGECAM